MATIWVGLLWTMRNNLIQNKKMSILFPFTATIAHLDNLYFRTSGPICALTQPEVIWNTTFFWQTLKVFWVDIRLGESLVESENRKEANFKVITTWKFFLCLPFLRKTRRHTHVELIKARQRRVLKECLDIKFLCV